MGENGNALGFQSGTIGQLGLKSHVSIWNKDKASAELLGMEWAALQGKYYGGESKSKYVTLGSIIACDSGSLFTRIKLEKDHGVETRSTRLPILTVLDFGDQNISAFGECKKKTEDIPFCIPQISNPWIQKSLTTSANQAALLEADAFAVCSTGGIICVKSVNKTPQEGAMCAMRDQFGFDQRTAKIMLELYYLIEKKYPNMKKIEVGWYYSRCLSQLGGYNNKKVGITKNIKIETHAWRSGAGIVFDYDEESMKTWFTKDIGLSSSDYLYLKQMIKLQNIMTSSPEDYSYEAAIKLSEGYKKDNKATDEFKDWVTNMERLGESFTDKNGEIDVEGYLQRYEEIYDSYEGKGDFPHMLYTIAAGLVDDDEEKQVHYEEWDGALSRFSGLGWSTSEERKKIAGWLGDSVFAPKGKVSFEYNDFVADLDADNIVHRMNDNTALIKVMDQYYQKPPLADRERIGEFLKNNKYEDVEKTIIEKIDLEDKNEDNKIDIEDLNNEKYGATYDFLKSLKARIYIKTKRDDE